jgi:hypothetical protein
MDILSPDKDIDRNQIISSLTVGELETLINQIVHKVVSGERQSLIPDEYKRDIPYNSEVNSIREIADSAAVPKDLWECVPSDASQNLDSYLYPKGI